MALTTAKYVQSNTSPLQFNSEFGWQEVSRGLRSVLRGYLALAAGILFGGLLIRSAVEGDWLVQLVGGTRSDRDTMLLLGVAGLGLGVVACYALVLVGQWRCLMYAPTHQNARELMYVCINCLAISSITNAIGLYLEGLNTYAALREGLEAVQALNYRSAGMLLQIVGCMVALFGALVYSQFLRNVASCFSNSSLARGLDFNVGSVGLMLGASVGGVIVAQRLAAKIDLMPWLAGGWLVCFSWHVWLVWRVRSCVEAGRHDRSPETETAHRTDGPGTVAIHSLAGLYKIARRAECDTNWEW